MRPWNRPISGWERPQWCSKATPPGPRGGDADAPETDAIQDTVLFH